MAINLSKYKVPVFLNINDAPVVPITSKAGNGADLIYRLNGLIDELSAIVNSGNVVTKWIAKLPTQTDYVRIEIYYVSSSERNIYKSVVESSSIYFGNSEPIRIHTLGVDRNTDGTIDISEVINKCGIGYYFFLFRNADGTLKGNSGAFATSSPIQGAVSNLEEKIFIAATNAKYPSSNYVSMNPLVVRQIVSNVDINLLSVLPTIG